MRWIAVLAGALACNSAPLDYREGKAPGAPVDWAGPTDDFCLMAPGESMEVDGFLFCAEVPGRKKIPVDDPVLVPCASAVDDAIRVVSVFDGVTARAYAVEPLLGRELVNDDFGDEPLLVDY